VIWSVGMGKIKNRDEKRKAAKVFTAGGGGGTKGPSVIDKRNQEQKCPHCDRIFKQPGRLNDHIKRQHADLTDTQEAPSSDTAAPRDAKNVSGSSSTLSVTEKQNAGPRIMDIGSKSGVYDFKSPKLILHEMLLKEKSPKAKYKSIFDKETSLWRCKVVLPHAKRSDNDVVVFLDSKHACKSEQEAQQRAAVVALHKIAGNRSLERTLPPSYVDIWASLNERAKVLEQRAQRDEERRKRESQIKAKALKKQGPSHVIMTEGHRTMIENILRDVKRPVAVENNDIDDLVSELQTLGFDNEDSRQAARQSTSLSAALDWLCLNIPEEKLPSDFASGAAGKPVTVLRSHKTGQPDTLSPEAMDPSLAELTSFGYGVESCMKALESHKGDVTTSAVPLFLSVCSSLGCRDHWGRLESYHSSQGVPSNEMFDEEKMALDAIFGDSVRFGDRGIVDGTIHVPITDDNAKRLESCISGLDCEEARTEGLPVHVKFMIPCPSDVGVYPDVLPVFTVQSACIPGRCMKSLTEILIRKLVEIQGQPVLYEVISCISEHLDKVIEEGTGGEKVMIRSQTSESSMENTMVHRATNRPLQSRKTSRGFTFSPAQIKEESNRLKIWHSKMTSSKDCSTMMHQRQKLPAAAMKHDVITAIETNRVTIIMGSTGCGKSTQIPQFILEHAIDENRGGECNIICTQPRRISAIGLASRVAQERSESVGSTVGYSVRLDSKQSKQTRIMFCTTGVMMRRLLSDPQLKSTSHIILDEVHERTIESDLLLFLLKGLILEGRNPNLKIVMMSATAEAHLFEKYFMGVGQKNPPVISIPGFTHPVQDFFLEDVIEKTQYQLSKSSKWVKKNMRKDDEIPKLQGDYSEVTAKTMALLDEALINTELIEKLVGRLLVESTEKKLGAILIFVPGAYLINKLVKGLQSSSSISGHGFKILALPLHGGLPPSQQSKVFERPPPGVTKIVVATNVAETSITIDDVTCVIDTGRANEVRFDAVKGISRLQEVYVSQASCQQRRGRAGRVQPGECYKLFSRKTWNNMDRNTLPEISRSALHALVMDTKAIVQGDIFDVLGNMLTPPPRDGLEEAVDSLKLMGAIDCVDQSLTSLGRHLTEMPCDPKLGKMLVYGAILRCVDPVLTIVAAQAFGKSVFWSSLDLREEAETAKLKLIGSNKASKSDHVAIIAAYNGWRRAFSTSGRRAASAYCTEYFISEQAMDSIHSGRRQYAQILADLGFIPQTYPAVACKADYVPPGLTKSAEETKEFASYGQPDEYAGHGKVVKAALASGFYPQLLRVQNPAAQFQKVHGGAFETEGSGGKVKLFDRKRGRVFIHPSSINFAAGKFESGWLVYSDIMETSKIFIRECSMVPVYAVLLFGGSIAVEHEKGMIIVDDWASFKAPARIGVLVRELRSEVARLLDEKIEDPTMNIAGSKLIDAMHHLLSTDGF
jgi:ATP-dependent RNA helicase DHX57